MACGHRASLRDRNLDNCSCVILPSNIHVGRMRFSDGVPAVRPYFFPTAAKSRQKGPLSSKVLTPIIDQIMQAAFSFSRQRKAQLAIHANSPA
jgi:hypothetical protein